jgi:hypothetical protein
LVSRASSPPGPVRLTPAAGPARPAPAPAPPRPHRPGHHPPPARRPGAVRVTRLYSRGHGAPSSDSTFCPSCHRSYTVVVLTVPAIRRVPRPTPHRPEARCLGSASPDVPGDAGVPPPVACPAPRGPQDHH